MGCDIHSFAEVRRNGQWTTVGEVFPLDDFDREWEKQTHGHEPFRGRSYGKFGFLAGVRNYSDVTPIRAPKGLPADLSPAVAESAAWWDVDGHSHSWLSLSELLAVDYDASIENRRYTKQISPNHFDGGATCEPGEGKQERLADFLGTAFMADLEVLKSLGSPDDVRVVFWFDN